MSAGSKEAAQSYVRLSLVNKLGQKNVGLILHENWLASINLLFKYRDSYGIHKDNEFLFATNIHDPDRDCHLEAYRILKKFAFESGIPDPHLISGTLLRKQFATSLNLLGLDERAYRGLAGFLGHDYEIHKNYYRVPIPEEELRNITPFLIEAGGIQQNTETQNTPTHTPDHEPDNGTAEESLNSTGSDFMPEVSASSKSRYNYFLAL
ncbi:hypothetical protein QAD02_000775 [Eretmocerus hayati]|uniref:Uncharacterized protein n=1 Tax=Eretmocerus hayati TaxID=131215 RepID=A0ACC2NEI9_9HYME|nr:hypothetical protein QAD02_000775 [Eretmocerus hayati]